MFTLTDTILEEAFASFTDGERKVCDEETLTKTAYHEAGHALVALLLGIKPLYATIAGRANYGGYVCYSEEDKRLFTREECRNRMCIALAGRAADVLSYGDGGISTGASSDRAPQPRWLWIWSAATEWTARLSIWRRRKGGSRRRSKSAPPRSSTNNMHEQSAFLQRTERS